MKENFHPDIILSFTTSHPLRKTGKQNHYSTYRSAAGR